MTTVPSQLLTAAAALTGSRDTEVYFRYEGSSAVIGCRWSEGTERHIYEEMLVPITNFDTFFLQALASQIERHESERNPLEIG